MARPKKEKPNARGLYEVTISLGKDMNGKIIRKHFYSTVSKDAARQKAEDWKVQQAVSMATGTFDQKNVTFRDVAEQVCNIKKSENKYSSWYSNYYVPIHLHLIPYFNDVLIKNIRKMDVDNYFVSKKDLSRVSLEHHRMTLKKIFEEAVNNDIIYKNPMCDFKLKVGKPSKDKKIMSQEHMILLLEYCRQNPCVMSIAVDLLARYGISRSELLGIQNKSVDKENKIISIVQGVTRQQNNKSVAGETKNKYRKRNIVISQSTVDLIDSVGSDVCGEYLISFNKGLLTTVNTFDFRFRKFINSFREFYQQQGIEIPYIHAHEFRHTRASHWIAEDKSLFAVAQQMGWSDLDMLRKRYGHAGLDTVRDLLDIH